MEIEFINLLELTGEVALAASPIVKDQDGT
jgi:hypothetical protein